ncbi:conserved membrane hypothetical protein [Bosea sp. 62]|uniref:hypothetical protein n=1 Tax=unclassified Bosea (in: a-proteobacteria) TaxID=2653178 RepID=UPI001252C1FA|nr:MULTISPECIES: hypothetical protein [unclassified Bosea (in: a-proteobacteria)]CAD5260573.1 conserved membrane hypothetical protein [Bosea sp. 46]CAD5265116.1 conserved membrane hypothetical protein [Bosea sp. 21B]CAD5275206.1 conserved membrane hypothetical protein [Bosea sp. 7B]VVT59178.1 conserved membrane hypothetical protein [Bosea sp. EC-HK365B]VXB72276.1 conserved membrane hypothetical protein [Bosea sp. 29B]
MPAKGLKCLFAALSAHVAHPGPREAIANTVALVIVSNQPFYPLYLYWAVSPVISPSLLTFLSTPLFALVPSAMRRNSRLGRCLLLCAGIGNTLLCRFAFGSTSGVEVFLFPCLMLSALLFRRDERIYAAGFILLSFAAYLLPVDAIAAPLHLYQSQEYLALQRLNFLSAASLTALIGWLFAGQRPDISAGGETGTGQRA